jgi:hypothetical protein
MSGERVPLGTEPSHRCQCGKPLPPRHRKYCRDCAPKASLLWKRELRRQNSGSSYWFDHWLKAAGSEEAGRRAYNAYMRDYMRRYRLRLRRNSPDAHRFSLTERQAGGYV